jgi:hypothetical protein
MQPLPFREETKVLCLNDPQRLARICGTHVVVQPQGRSGLLVAEPHHDFTASCALHVDVGRLVLARRRVHIDTKLLPRGP